jgi:hypothetical protein
METLQGFSLQVGSLLGIAVLRDVQNNPCKRLRIGSKVA